MSVNYIFMRRDIIIRIFFKLLCALDNTSHMELQSISVCPRETCQVMQAPGNIRMGNGLESCPCLLEWDEFHLTPKPLDPFHHGF
jgi:hypothetical protein